MKTLNIDIAYIRICCLNIFSNYFYYTPKITLNKWWYGFILGYTYQYTQKQYTTDKAYPREHGVVEKFITYHFKEPLISICSKIIIEHTELLKKYLYREYNTLYDNFADDKARFIAGFLQGYIIGELHRTERRKPLFNNLYTTRYYYENLSLPIGSSL